MLVPDDGKLAIEVRGNLAGILALGINADARREGRASGALLEQVKLVAGARNTLHLLTEARVPERSARSIPQRSAPLVRDKRAGPMSGRWTTLTP